jgi:hypothetical protein
MNRRPLVLFGIALVVAIVVLWAAAIGVIGPGS